MWKKSEIISQLFQNNFIAQSHKILTSQPRIKLGQNKARIVL